MAIEITGLPSLDWSKHMSQWVHDMIKERAHEIAAGHRITSGLGVSGAGGGVRPKSAGSLQEDHFDDPRILPELIKHFPSATRFAVDQISSTSRR